MNILVFSDSHLSLPFEEKKYNFLEGIISEADRVIINGDFWDGYLTTFKEFSQSPWRNLFPLLKSKKTVYIFGNHDRDIFSNEQIYLFSAIQTQQYKLKINGITYIFEHGNRLLPLGDGFIDKAPDKPIKIVKYMDRLEKLLIKKSGSHYQRLFKKNNQKIKVRLKKEIKSDEYYVCGHTHCAEVDHKNRFINTGLIKHGLAQYLQIKDNALYFKQEKYL